MLKENKKIASDGREVKNWEGRVEFGRFCQECRKGVELSSLHSQSMLSRDWGGGGRSGGLRQRSTS